MKRTTTILPTPNKLHAEHGASLGDVGSNGSKNMRIIILAIILFCNAVFVYGQIDIEDHSPNPKFRYRFYTGALYSEINYKNYHSSSYGYKVGFDFVKSRNCGSKEVSIGTSYSELNPRTINTDYIKGLFSVNLKYRTPVMRVGGVPWIYLFGALNDITFDIGFDYFIRNSDPSIFPVFGYHAQFGILKWRKFNIKSKTYTWFIQPSLKYMFQLDLSILQPSLTLGMYNGKHSSCFYHFCFIQGTMIDMNNLRKEISKVNIGDTILTFNLEEGVIEQDIVVQTYEVKHDNLVNIYFNDSTMNTNTNDHPYWVIDKGYCSLNPEMTFKKYKIVSSKLELGDRCLKIEDGIMEEIRVSRFENKKGEYKTYTFKTKRNHNYFANGILVSDEFKTNEPLLPTRPM